MAASKISLLEDSVARHLARHQDLEDELQVCVCVIFLHDITLLGNTVVGPV